MLDPCILGRILQSALNAGQSNDHDTVIKQLTLLSFASKLSVERHTDSTVLGVVTEVTTAGNVPVLHVLTDKATAQCLASNRHPFYINSVMVLGHDPVITIEDNTSDLVTVSWAIFHVDSAVELKPYQVYRL